MRRFAAALLPAGCALAASLLLAGCSQDAVDQPDSGQSYVYAPRPEAGAHDTSVVLDVNMAPYPAPHAAAPQVQSFGGPVLAAPRIVPIFFVGDPLQAQIEQFLGQLHGSSYWAAATREYGVGDITVAPSIVAPGAPGAMITDDQIRAWLSQQLDGAHAGWPAATPDDIYMVFYPESTTLTMRNPDGTMGVSCKDFGGYHDEGAATAAADGGTDGGSPDAEGDAAPDDAAGGDDGATADAPAEADAVADADADGADAGAEAGGPTPFVYSPIPRCQNFDGFSGLDMVTLAISHESAEAATDPFVMSNPAYATADPDHVVWDFAPFGELGDMCVYEPQSFQPLVGTFVVQRIWSNKAAAAGLDPCSPPLSGAVYLNAAPDLDDAVTLTVQGQSVPTKGVKIPVGQSKTISLRLFSTGPTSDWGVGLQDLSAAYGGAALLSFSPSTFNGNNGDVVQVTITALGPGPMGGSEFLVYSYRSSSYINYWFGFVQN